MQLTGYDSVRDKESWVLPDKPGCVFYYYPKGLGRWAYKGDLKRGAKYSTLIKTLRELRMSYIEEHLKWEVADGKA